MDPEEINDGLLKAGYSQALIARITGYTRSHVNSNIYQRDGNKAANPIVRAAIATALRKPIDEVFKDHVQFYCRVYTILSKPKEIVNGKP